MMPLNQRAGTKNETKINVALEIAAPRLPRGPTSRIQRRLSTEIAITLATRKIRVRPIERRTLFRTAPKQVNAEAKAITAKAGAPEE